MSCFKNGDAEINFNDLKKLYDEETALTIISRNNGYSLKYTKTGEESILFNDLLIVTQGNIEQALKLKIPLYNTNFISEPSLTEYTQLPLDEIILNENDFNKSRVATHLINKAREFGIKKHGGQRYQGKADTITNNEPMATMNSINKVANSKIASVVQNVVVITIEKNSKLVAKRQKEYIKKTKDKIQAEVTAAIMKNDIETTKRNEELKNNTLVEKSIEDANFFGSQSVGNESFIQYKLYKQEKLIQLKKKKTILQGKKKLYSNPIQAKQVLTELVRVNEEIKILSNEIDKLDTETNAANRIVDMANDELDRIEILLKKGLSDNIKEIEDVLKYYTKLGNFEQKITDHPIFRDNKVFSDKDMKKALKEITDKAVSLTDDMNTKIEDAIYDHLFKHRSFKKVGLNNYNEEDLKKMLFENRFDDINLISSYLLNPDYNMSGTADNLVAQVMRDEHRKLVSENNGFVSRIMGDIDRFAIAAKHIVKGDYSIFYQKDSDGNLTPHLINVFSAAWFSFTAGIDIAYNKAIANTKKTGSTNFGTSDKAKFKKITDSADFIDIKNIPKIKDAYGKNKEIKWGTDAEMQQTEQNLIAILGKNEYERIINEQIKLIEEYILTREAEKQRLFKLDGVESGLIEDLSKKGKIELAKFDLRNDPFNVSKAVEQNDGGTITKKNKDGINQTIDGEEVVTTVNTEFIEYIPKKDSNYFNGEFNKIKNDELLYKLWASFSEALQYINNTLVATGESRITFNSLFDMQQNILNGIFKGGFYSGNLFSRIHNKFASNIRNFLTKGKDGDEFIKKDKDSTSINTGSLNKSLKAKIDSKVNHLMGIIEESIDSNGNINPNVVRKLLKWNLPSKDFNKITNFNNKVVIKDILKKAITKQVMDQQDLDLPKVIKQYLAIAASVDTSISILPKMRAMQKIYNRISKSQDPENPKSRTKATDRLDDWIDRVVRLYVGFKGIPIGIKLKSKDERRIQKELKLLITLIDNDAGKQVIQDQIDKLGSPINAGIIMSMIQSFVIWKSMFIRPLSGFFNLAHGYESGMFHDKLGTAWTTGNFSRSFSFVLGKGRRQFYNLATFSGAGKVFNWKQHGEQIDIAELFFNKINIILDPRNIKQKASRKLGKETKSILRFAQPYYLSITAPEWRNQGAAIIAVLMDAEISTKPDINGVVTTHKMFEKRQFTAYDNVDYEGYKKGEKYKNKAGKNVISQGGLLRLKEKFRTAENIRNWEGMSKDAGDYKAFHSNASTAVGITAGDFDPNGGMRIKNTQLGSMMMTFLTFTGTYLWSRFGSGINLATGSNREKSVFNAATPGTAGIWMGMIGTFLLGPAPGAILLGAVYAGKTIQDLATQRKYADNKAKGLLIELIYTLQGVVQTALGTPLTLLAGRDIATGSNQVDLIKDKIILSDEDKKSTEALLFEIGNIMGLMVAKIVTLQAIKCKDGVGIYCKEREAIMNWMVNNYDRYIGDIALPGTPLQLFASYTTNGSVLIMIDKLLKLVGVSIMYDEMSDEIIGGESDGESRSKKAFHSVIIPGIVNDINAFRVMTPSMKEYAPHQYWKLIAFENEYLPDGVFDNALVNYAKEVAFASEPQSTKKIFSDIFRYYGDTYVKTDKEKAAAKIKILRRKEKNKGKTSKEIDALYPTINAKVKLLKKKYPNSWKTELEYYMEDIEYSYDEELKNY